MLSAEKIIDLAHAANASDVHIVCGLPIKFRIHGRLVNGGVEGDAKLTHDDCEELARELAGKDYDDIAKIGEWDGAATLAGVRTRINLFRSQGNCNAALRLLSDDIPQLDTLGLPPAVLDFPKIQRGIVLVTGETGSGKSTTLAALIDAVNHVREENIITMEDPIEYVHRHGTCIITQREIPTDVATYAEALRSAMRESPNVILLGEMRDPDTISTAVSAAEMAQLVLSTLHTTSAADTVERILDAFPPNQQRQVRIQLSMVLQATVAQRLVPTVDGGTTPVFEIMIMNTAIRNLIREEKSHQIDSVIAAGGAQGMQTMDQGLFNAVRKGIVAKDVALQHANHQEALARRFEAEGM